MELQTIVDIIMNNGLGLGCVIYLIVFQNTTMKEMLTTLTSINTRLTIIEENLKGSKE